MLTRLQSGVLSASFRPTQWW